MVSLNEMANQFIGAAGYPVGTLVKAKIVKSNLLPSIFIAADVYVKKSRADRAVKIGSVIFNFGNLD